MAALKLSLDTIGDLDSGMVRLMADREIQKMIADLEDRGAEDKQPRVLTLKLAVGVIEGRAVAKVTCEAKLPPLRSRTTQANLKAEAGKFAMFFQPANPQNPDQDVFPFDPETGEIANPAQE